MVSASASLLVRQLVFAGVALVPPTATQSSVKCPKAKNKIRTLEVNDADKSGTRAQLML